MDNKVCFKCGEAKPISEFYRHKEMADGHLNKCKSCTKRDASVNRLLHLERIRAYDRGRGSRQGLEYQKQYRINHPTETVAKNMVNNYVRDGKLLKPDYCTVCGISGVRIYGHHADYSKPLDVLWCCQACHKAEHAKICGNKTHF